jgi:hypothetical protein
MPGPGGRPGEPTARRRSAAPLALGRRTARAGALRRSHRPPHAACAVVVGAFN